MALSTPLSQSDGELLAEFASRRNEAAFAELVSRHGGMVLSVCRSVLGHTADAQDAAQAVFLTLAKKAQSLSAQTCLVGWLHRVAWYVAARAAKARAIRRRHEQEAASMRPELQPSPEEPIQFDLLHAGLAQLADKYRVPLILHHMEGRSHAQTAALTGCGVDAVAVRLHRGREMLRKRLRRLGVVASVAALAGVWGGNAMADVPPEFVASAAKAAMAVLRGSAAVTSGEVMALSEGAMKMLFWTKTKMAAMALAFIIFLGGVVGTVLVAKAGAINAPPPITGVISQVQDGQITLQRRTGAVTVAIDNTTVIKVDDKLATIADLKVGMSAAAFVPEDKPATEIRAYTPKPAPPHAGARTRVFTGVICQLGEGTIAVLPRTGPPEIVTINAATVIHVNDKPAIPADLTIDMSVAAFFETDQPATEIRAYSPGNAPPPPQ